MNESRHRSPLTTLALAAGGYLLLLALVELLTWAWLVHRHPYLAYFRPLRAYQLVKAKLAGDLFERVAYLSFPLLTLALVANWRRPDPATELGLTSPRGWWQLPLGVAQGAGALLTSAWLVALCGGAGARRELVDWLRHMFDHWRRQEPSVGLFVVLLSFAYALSRTVVPLGELPARARRALPAAPAALVVAAVFALSHLDNGYLSPLAAANLLLLGLVFERYRRTDESLLRVLGLLTGWTLVGRFLGLSSQGVGFFENDLFKRLPTWLSGGVYGLEGSLATTAVVVVWLTWCLRPRSAAPMAAPMAAPVAAAVEESVRPGGFEPPTP